MIFDQLQTPAPAAGHLCRRLHGAEVAALVLALGHVLVPHHGRERLELPDDQRRRGVHHPRLHPGLPPGRVHHGRPGRGGQVRADCFAENSEENWAFFRSKSKIMKFSKFWILI